MSYLKRVAREREKNKEREAIRKHADQDATISGRKGSWDVAAQPVPDADGKSPWRRAYEAMTHHLSMKPKEPVKIVYREREADPRTRR